MISIGIDPGLSGAIAILDGQASVYDMPTVQLGKTGFVKRAVDGHQLGRLLRPYARENMIGQSVTVFLERVNAFPGQGVGSMFSLGMSFWGAFCVCGAIELPVTLVEPKEWKAHFRLTKDKELARGLATRMYPTIDLGRKKDHNRAEALLIATYGQYRQTDPISAMTKIGE